MQKTVLYFYLVFPYNGWKLSDIYFQYY